MTSEAKRRELHLWIASGPHLDALAPFLSALGAPFERGRVAELAQSQSPPALVLLHADDLGAEDVLDVRRFLARESEARLLLLGDDAGRRGVRALLRSERARWMSWPPDIDDVRAIAAGASRSRPDDAREPARREAFASSSAHVASDASISADAERARSASEGFAPSSRAAPPPSALEVDVAEIERVLGPAHGAEVRPAHGVELDPAYRAALHPAHGAERFAPSRDEHRAPQRGESPPAKGTENSPPQRDLDLSSPRAEHGAPRSADFATPPHATTGLSESRSSVFADEETSLDPMRAEASGSAAAPAISRPSSPLSPASEPFRAQVADLADIAQRIEFSVQALREASDDLDDASADPRALDALTGDVARLIQFARTLGYVVSPPGPGSQLVDLTEMLELFLSEIRSSGPDAPRCLLRSNGTLRVRSDRQLLSQAFDALFFTARNAAGRGEIVRVQARRDDEAIPPVARVSIDFPAGKLRDVPAATLLEPYALRRVLPDLGPNSLAAAARILQGQGGSCRLEPQARGRLEWMVTLPLAAAGDERAVESASSAAARADDPFA